MTESKWNTKLDVTQLAALEFTVQPLLVLENGPVDGTSGYCVHCDQLPKSWEDWTDEEKNAVKAYWAVTTPTVTVAGYTYSSNTNKVCNKHLPDEIQNIRDWYLNEVL